MEIIPIRTEGLGDSTYIVSHDGLGIVVDPQRDIDRFADELTRLDLTLRWVLETHLHNDYVSGAKDLARAYDAELVVPAGAAPVFRHTPAYHHEAISESSLTIRPIHTPGHTPEHVSYLLIVDGVETAVFSGGSLLVGSAGRSDLLGMDRADTLARLQFESVGRLAMLPAPTGLFPTHGAGSFCTASGAGNSSSTIGEEKRTNPVLQHPDVDAFVSAHLSGLVPYPDYYRHMGPANIAGYRPSDLSRPPTLDEKAFEGLEDVVVVDARPKGDFASGHIPGSIGIELRNDFGVWVGWVVPFDARLVLVINADQSVEEAQRQLTRIGFDRVVGIVESLGDWKSPLASFSTVGPAQFGDSVAGNAQVLDVRAPSEWETGTLQDSTLCYVPDLAKSLPADLDRDRPVHVACGTGYRATIAASFLKAEGFEPVVLVGGGVPEVLDSI